MKELNMNELEMVAGGDFLSVVQTEIEAAGGRVSKEFSTAVSQVSKVSIVGSIINNTIDFIEEAAE